MFYWLFFFFPLLHIMVSLLHVEISLTPMTKQQILAVRFDIMASVFTLVPLMAQPLYNVKGSSMFRKVGVAPHKPVLSITE